MKKTTKRLAERIADELMTNSEDEFARRLQLRGPCEEDLGGRCYDNVVDTVAKVLDSELSKPTKTKGAK